MKWSGVHIFVGEALPEERLGVEETDEGRWSCHLGSMRLGVLHQNSRTILPIAGSDD